ncbi:hypothetical protein CR513_37323, partial [Mucuna pruriens]
MILFQLLWTKSLHKAITITEEDFVKRFWQRESKISKTIEREDNHTQINPWRVRGEKKEDHAQNYLNFEHFLLHLNDKQTHAYISLFTYHDKSSFGVVLIYVDDVIVIGTYHYHIVSLALNHKYILDILVEYGLLGCKLVIIPMEQQTNY